MKSRRFVLARRPRGVPVPEDFRLEEIELGDLAEGEILVANRFVSVDPGMRARLSSETTYAPPLAIGEVVEAATAGEVLASRNQKFRAGDLVVAGFGWQEHAISSGRGVRVVADRRVPLSAWIGVLGIPGLTAYFGLLDVGALQEGETVVVTSAAGAVGATAGQIAKIHGCRVVGVAGGPAKCAWLTDELGFDAAVDYRAASDLRAAISAVCPEGVDVLFDNVGNETIDAVLPLMKSHGRIVVSGQVADYNRDPAERRGLTGTMELIGRRLTMRGFVAFDFARRFPEAWQRLIEWIESGRLRYREDIDDGFERLPVAFAGLFSGANFGRKLVRL